MAGADNLCNQDSNYPGSGTYKAMLADGVVELSDRSATILLPYPKPRRCEGMQ
ncbi:MAG: DUF1554 domain-containing protein [Bdellovibrio sp.]